MSPTAPAKQERTQNCKVHITAEDVLDRIRKDVEDAGSQRTIASEVGVSEAYLSRVLMGQRSIGAAIARHYGLTAERIYRKDER